MLETKILDVIEHHKLLDILLNQYNTDFERKDGSVLKISQCEEGDVGCVVWDAAIVLASYLECIVNADNSLISKNTRVVELGAGTGLVGLQAACLGASVHLTDLPELLPLLERNISDNTNLIKGSASALALSWGEPLPDKLPNPPDVILVADCVYYNEAVEPLVSTICDIAGPTTVVLCCYEEREIGNKEQLQNHFFELIGKTFDIEKVKPEEQDPTYQSEDIHLFKFKLRV